MTTTTSTSAPWIGRAISHLATLLRGGSALSAGDIASLRRMDAHRPSAAFYKVAGLALDGRLPETEVLRPSLETRWAAVILGLAHLGPLHKSGPEYRLGLVLAMSAYPEVRFARLLGADAERLVDEIPTLARRLAALGTPVDWTGAAKLLLSAGRPGREEKRRRHLARDYYGLLARQDSH